MPAPTLAYVDARALGTADPQAWGPSWFASLDPMQLVAQAAGTCGQPVSFRLVDGALPAGTQLDASTGEISGTPHASGSFNPVVAMTVTGSTQEATATASFTADDFGLHYLLSRPQVAKDRYLTVPAVIDDGLAVDAGSQFNISNAKRGALLPGTASMRYSIASGALPPGMSLDPASGLIYGSPSQVGTYQATVRVVASVGQSTLAAARDASLSFEVLFLPEPGDITVIP